MIRKAMLVAMVAATSAWADVDVCYYGGPNLPNFKLNGNAKLDGTDLVITEAIGGQGSSAAYNSPLSTAGNISVRMKVKISANGGGGADGIAFVMHNDPTGTSALGALGGGIGYQGLTKSVIVEFDTYTNASDPNDSHVAVQKNGDPSHSGVNAIALVSNPGVTLKSGTPFWTWIDYTGTTKNLKVYIATTSTKPATAIVDATVDVPTIVGAQMYLSFTGSTGGSWSKHEVMELLASDHGAAGAYCCATGADCAASSLGPICDPVKRVCGPCTLGDTTECTGVQQSCQVSSAINQCVAPCTGNLGAGGSNPCTTAAFPVCSTSGASTGSCVACNADCGRAGQACPAGAPTCLANGYCGRCTSNFDCASSASHAGNYCTVATGTCTTCSTASQCGGSMTCTGGQCLCTLDSDCGANGFCESGSCLPKRPAGQAMPGSRTCPASAAAVCTTARCNATTTTCAATGGMPCTQATQCTANLCGADSLCGCTVDGDCGAAEHCAYATRSCVADLAEGTAIPSDGLHGGTCTDAAAVCASGLCNSTTSTCAASDGATCAANNQCQSNTCKSGHCVPPASGCWADVDCPASSFCNRAALTCAADLAVGTSIPSDGLHGGTCTDAVAVCASGLCNASTSTCAANNGSTCSANSECQSNSCKSGHCVPSGASGCWADADCAASSYCDRAGLACAPDLAVGTSIPSDGLHGGTCTDAAAVCVSGLCNSTTSTCAANDTSTCTANDQCQSNSCKSGHCVPTGASGCWADADCAASSFCNRAALTCAADLAAGTPVPSDGLHGGTCSDAAAVCVSATCNATTNTCAASNGLTCSADDQCQSNSCKSGHCVPAGATGCWADSDCGASSYCDRWTYSCVADLAAGAGVPIDGLHGGTCADAAAVCATGLCNASSNTCAANDTSSCSANSECQSNSCKSGHCVPSGANGCWADGDCAGTSFCNRTALTCAADLASGSAIPSDGLHGGTCTDAAAVCATGLCNSSNNTCAASDTASCTANNQCQSNSCKSGHCVPTGASGCWADADCAGTSFCNRTTLTCAADLAAGSAIPSDGLHGGTCTDAAAVCATGLCNSSSNTCAASDTASCSANNQCQSNSCKSGHCVPTGASGCWADADCAGTSFCNRTALTCAADLAAGTAIPSDGLHGGTCTDAAAVCATGLCNSSSNTCAASDTASCSANNECQSNSCKSGHCVPTGASGCWADADCAGTSFCNRTALTCAADLGAGTAIPSDGLHGGTCTDAAAVCATGLCNTSSNTCAASDTTTCTTNAQCQSNSCKSGHCVPTGASGCWADADCAGTSFCNRTALTCAADLSAGSAIPSDGLHGGTCTDAAAVCATGLCNTSSNTCAASDTSSCSANNQCQSNSCRSGHCVPTGASGCWADTDCAGTSFCNRTALTCAADLGAGSAIPSDGLHGGTCTDAAAVCATGLCNASSNTCAANDTSSCSANNQCQSNSCKSGHCVPTGASGCWADADCAGTSFCNRTTLTCAADLGAGSAIPTDGLHGGTCTDAAAVCATGLCNASSNTCAASNTASCSANNECQSNSCRSGHCVPVGASGCWADADCAGTSFCNRTALTCAADLGAGTAIPSDGLHGGTCTDAAAVCATGLCNASSNTCAAANSATCTANAQCTTNTCTSGRCVPAMGGCFLDADCPLANHCARATLTCVADLAAGTAIPSDGLHGGTCADATAVCTSGLCNASSNTCATGEATTCTTASECASNACTSGHCVAAVGGCWVDSECPATSYCDRATLACRGDLPQGRAIPTDGLHGGTCADAASVCASGVCNTSSRTCGAAPGASCVSATECAANTCTSGHCVPATGGCYVDGDCAAASHCNRATFTCVADKVAGEAIPNDGLHDGLCSVATAAATCVTGACNATSNTCATGTETICSSNSECTTNACTSGRCVPPGNGCYVDADCAASSFCDRATLSCVADLAAGRALPADGLHDGQCTASLAMTVCTSGVCNPSSNTCAAVDGAMCTTAADCTSNACTSFRCVPNSGGCFVDHDCGSAAWCDRATLTCTPKLTPGAPIPNDGLHDGVCTPETGATVCASGLCNETTDTCGQEVGGDCVSDAQCTNNTCTSRRCVPATNGCGQSSDCGAGAWCDGATFTCRQQLVTGSALPRDDLHFGVCTPEVGASVCSSGACNPETNACALADEAACTTDAECGSNSCVAGQCGGGLFFSGGPACSVTSGRQPPSSGWLVTWAALALVVMSRRRRG